ncbi:hypothetical protein ACFX2F_028134 [Malus domestica]
MKCHRLEGIRRRIGYSQGFNVPPIGVVSGLSLWWHEPTEVRVEFSTNNIIHSSMREYGKGVWIKAS